MMRQTSGNLLMPAARHQLKPETANSFRQLVNQAFTLIELMVVMVIIAMLAGLLLKGIFDARDHARATHCRNNLRQLGVAMGKYQSDWDTYFIRASAAGEKGATCGINVPGGIMADRASDGFDISRYDHGLQGHMGSEIGGISGHDYQRFINDYVDANSAHCPEVNQAIFQTNSRTFKGLSYNSYDGYQLDYVGAKCSYAINGNALNKRKSDLKDSQFAFIDWNAAQGWGASIKWGTSKWMMEKDTVGAAVKELYQDAGTDGKQPLKNDVSYHTEIGYHHRSGTNYIANYLAMDGRVGTIASNAPDSEFRRLFLGQ